MVSANEVSVSNHINQMQSFFVYILLCADNSYYTGHTDNIETRITEHESLHFETYTSTRLPIKLVYLQDFQNRDEAINAEQQIKRWSRKKKEALINQNWGLLKILAKKNFKKNGSIHASGVTHHERK